MLKFLVKSMLKMVADAAKVNFEVALAVLECAVEEGVAGANVPKEGRRAWAAQRRWTPEYPEYEYAEDGLK